MDSLQPIERFVWIDTETFGLNPETDPIIEVGIAITDLELNFVDDMSIVIWSGQHDKRYSQLQAEAAGGNADAKYVLEMHEKSGLWNEDPTDTPETAEQAMYDFLAANGIGKDDPMAGSSIQFDRNMLAAQYFEIEQIFSYRNIDLSTLKELCRRLNPELYSKLENAWAHPKKEHRVLPDIEDSISEYKFYQENFLYV